MQPGEGAPGIFYSYTKHINGFAANLEPGDAAEIASEPPPTHRTNPRIMIYIFF